MIAEEIERLGKAAGVPEECVRLALKMCEGIEAKRLPSPEAVAAAALYVACRMNRTPWSLIELKRYVEAPRREISRAMKRFSFLKLPPPTAADYIRSAAVKFGLDEAIINKALEIARELKNLYPNLAAAVAIYIAASTNGVKLSTEDLAKLVGASMTALLKKLREMGAVGKRIERSREGALLGHYIFTRPEGVRHFVLCGAAALELAYNLYEAGLLGDAELRGLEEKRIDCMRLDRHALEELGAVFLDKKTIYVRAIADKLGLDATTTNKALEIVHEIKSVRPHIAAAVAIYMAAWDGGRLLDVYELARTAGVSMKSFAKTLKELGVSLNQIRRSSEEIALLGPYKFARRTWYKNGFTMANMRALELAHNLHEAGLLDDDKLAKIEERAAKGVYYIYLNRSLLAALGAKFKPSRRRTRKRVVFGPYVFTKQRDGFMVYGPLALELAYNLYEAGLLSASRLAKIEERVTRGPRDWRMSIRRSILKKLGAISK